jgi:hypothetical protein
VSLAHCFGVGEGTSLDAKEFGFQQGRGNGRAIDGDKWIGGSAAQLVDSMGGYIFAGAALALEQNVGGIARDLAHHGRNVLHSFALSHNHWEQRFNFLL